MLVFARRGIPCPDGSWNQHAETQFAHVPRPGDLGFWEDITKARLGNPRGTYHVGIIFDDNVLVEARARDDKGRYGKVIYRPRRKWEAWEPFLRAGGWRRLKVLL